MLGVIAGALMSISAISGWAQSPSPNTPAPRSRLITLGTRAGPIPTLWRAQSSNVLIVDKSYYVVDTGPGVMRRLLEAGIEFRNIDTIFITHGHNDHTAGLGELLTVIYSYGRTKPVHIYGPPGTEGFVAAQLRALKFDSDIRISDGTRSIPIAQIFIGHDAGTGLVFQDANVKVTSVENSHFNFPQGKPAFGLYKSYSYRFDAPDRSIVFTGDTGPSEAVTTLAKGADLLLSEVFDAEQVKAARVRDGQWASWSVSEQTEFMRHLTDEHLSPSDVAKMATRAGVKSVVLTHLSPSGDPKDEYGRFADAVKKGYSGEVAVAQDLKEF